MHEFKVGDWVIGEDICYNKNKKSTTTSKLKEIRSVSQFAYPYLLENGSFCAKIKKWSPKEGDWCWFCEDPENFPIGFILDRFLRMSKYNSFETKHSGEYYDYCFPFIGEFPYEA